MAVPRKTTPADLAATALLWMIAGAAALGARHLRLRYGWLDGVGDVEFWLIACCLGFPLVITAWFAILLALEALRDRLSGSPASDPRPTTPIPPPTGQAIKAAKPEGPPASCPLCALSLSGRDLGTCPRCKLFWYPSDPLGMPLSTEPGEPVKGGRFELTFGSSRLASLNTLSLLFFGVLGSAAALLSITSLIQEPGRYGNWGYALVGVPLGGWVGAAAGLLLLQELLRSLVPSRLTGERSGLRVRVWNTWGGLWAGCFRTDALVPWKDIPGVAIDVGQFEDVTTSLGILHSSGLAFSSGRIGRKDVARRLGQRLARWLSAQGAEAPSRESLGGWPIDLERLYGLLGWKRRTRFRLTERLFEAPDGGACVLLYHVGELGVHKEVGRAAVFRRGEPQPVLDAGRTLFWALGEGAVQWSADGRLAFLYEYKEVTGWFGAYPHRLEIQLHILDVVARRRCRWEQRLDDFHPVRPLEAGRLQVGPYTLSLDSLPWRRF